MIKNSNVDTILNYLTMSFKERIGLINRYVSAIRNSQNTDFIEQYMFYYNRITWSEGLRNYNFNELGLEFRELNDDNDFLDFDNTILTEKKWLLVVFLNTLVEGHEYACLVNFVLSSSGEKNSILDCYNNNVISQLTSRELKIHLGVEKVLKGKMEREWLSHLLSNGFTRRDLSDFKNYIESKYYLKEDSWHLCNNTVRWFEFQLWITIREDNVLSRQLNDW